MDRRSVHPELEDAAEAGLLQSTYYECRRPGDQRNVPPQVAAKLERGVRQRTPLSSEAAAPNQRWVGDTTEFVIATSGKLYLAVLLLC